MLKQFQISSGKIAASTGAESTISLFVAPTEEERLYLTRTLGIDEYSLQSALDPYEPARLKFEPGHTELFIKRPKRYSSQDNFLFKVESLGLFLFADKLVILLDYEIPLFETREFASVGSLQDAVLKIIFSAVMHFEEHIKVISMVSDELERQINTSMQNRQLISMFTLEKSLVFYLNAIGSNGRVIEKIRSNTAKFGLSPENLELLDDLTNENAQCLEMVQIYSQVLSSLMDARASLISNNLNIMMKNLNALVISVAVPSFFAGMGGMSEFSNMIGFSHWKFGYAFFFCGMLLIGVGTFFIIKWIERFWKD